MSAADPRGPGALESVLVTLVSVAAFFFWWVLVNPLGSQLLNMAVAMIAGRAAVALLGARVKPRDWAARFALTLPKGRTWAALVLLAPGFLWVLELQNALFASIGLPPQRGTFEVTPLALGLDRPGWLPPAILVLVVLTPLCAELLFRGWMQPGLVARHGRWKGLLLASLLAGGAHVGVVAFGSTAGPLVLLAVFGWNLLLGWVRESTGSTLASMIVRALANALLLAAFAMAADHPIAGVTAQGTHLPPALLIVSALSVAGGLRLLRRGPRS